MGRLILFLTVLTVLIMPITANANLLQNGGFENGTWTSSESVPDNWWKWSDNWGWAGWGNNSEQAYEGNGFVYDGGYENGQYAYFGQTLYDVVSEAVYEYSVWAKTEDWGSPTGSLKVEFKDASNNSLRVDSLELFNGSRSGTWTQYTLTTGAAPEGTTSINFLLYGGVSGTAQFDNAGAIIIPEPTSIMLLCGLALFLKRK